MPQKNVVKVGDMWLTAQQVPKRLWAEFGFEEGSVLNEDGVAEGTGTRDKRFRWPNAVLNYELSNSVKSEHQTIIRSTLAQLETKLDTNIRFKEIDHGFRVIVEMDIHCSSHVGWMSGSGPEFTKSQSLKLTEGCATDPASIEHEFLHALGVEHTQGRTDRDRYVKINWENIKDEEEYNFFKLSGTEVSEFVFRTIFTA